MSDKKVLVNHQERIHTIVDVYKRVVHAQCGTPMDNVEVKPVVFNLVEVSGSWSYTIGQLGVLNQSGLFVLKPVMQFPGGSYMLDHFTTALQDASIPWHHGM